MKKRLVIPEIEFDFNSEEEYYGARTSGYIDTYKMARIVRIYSDGCSVDYPCHSKESFLEEVQKYSTSSEELVSFEAYQSVHSYDINDYQ